MTQLHRSIELHGVTVLHTRSESRKNDYRWACTTSGERLATLPALREGYFGDSGEGAVTFERRASLLWARGLRQARAVIESEVNY